MKLLETYDCNQVVWIACDKPDWSNAPMTIITVTSGFATQWSRLVRISKPRDTAYETT